MVVARDSIPRAVFALLAATSVAACRPDTEGGASLIATPRVLAIQSLPAEAPPGAKVSWSALYVAADQTDAQDLSWALCVERKPIAVAGPIALECLAPSAESLLALGSGSEVAGSLPKDACRVFGPSPPAPKPGEPPTRPADADSSGGYYQPVRIQVGQVGDDYAVGFTRVSCGLSGATVEQSLDYAKRYRANENPALDQVTLDPEGSVTPLSESLASPTLVSAGASLSLRASWSDCPLDSSCGDGICGAGEDRTNCTEDCNNPHGCTGSEPYVALDPLERRIVARRESMRASWFASAGSFEHDRSGRTEAEASISSTDNRWTAPESPGLVRIWIALRDDRGGVGYRSYYVDVQ